GRSTFLGFFLHSYYQLLSYFISFTLLPSTLNRIFSSVIFIICSTSLKLSYRDMDPHIAMSCTSGAISTSISYHLAILRMTLRRPSLLNMNSPFFQATLSFTSTCCIWMASLLITDCSPGWSILYFWSVRDTFTFPSNRATVDRGSSL